MCRFFSFDRSKILVQSTTFPLFVSRYEKHLEKVRSSGNYSKAAWGKAHGHMAGLWHLGSDRPQRKTRSFLPNPRMRRRRRLQTVSRPPVGTYRSGDSSSHRTCSFTTRNVLTLCGECVIPRYAILTCGCEQATYYVKPRAAGKTPRLLPSIFPRALIGIALKNDSVLWPGTVKQAPGANYMFHETLNAYECWEGPMAQNFPRPHDDHRRLMPFFKLDHIRF